MHIQVPIDELDVCALELPISDTVEPLIKGTSQMHTSLMRTHLQGPKLTKTVHFPH